MKLSERRDAAFSAVCSLGLLSFALYGTVSLARHGDVAHPNPVWRGSGWHMPLVNLVAIAGLFGAALGWRAASKWRGAKRAARSTSDSNNALHWTPR
jgi:hypothetical protein